MKNYFCVDAETDGLYGEVWAIGAVVMDDKCQIVDSFECCIRNPQLKDQWVIDNILGVVTSSIKDENKIDNYDDMLQKFWDFWMKHRESSICIVDVGYPVESHLFRVCVDKNRQERQWNGPYPTHEVATMLFAKGINPDINRIEFVENHLKNNKYETALLYIQFEHHKTRKHNPLSDAYISCLCFHFCNQTN
jgi:hypothetical protein